MTTNFDIIKKHVKEGSFADCFGQRNTRCLTGLQKNVWMIEGENGISAYYDLTQRIYKQPKIHRNYTVKHVEKVLDSLILNSIGKPTITQEDILKEANKQLHSSKLEVYDICRNIFGITLSKNYRKIGPFVFQKSENAYKHYFRGKQWKFPEIKKDFPSYVIRYQFESVTMDRAIEIADDTFTTLEYLFAFIFGNKDCGHEVRIIRQTKENRLSYISKSEDGKIKFGKSRQNSVHNEIDLNDPYFKETQTKRLFSLVQPRGLTPIENRLNKAITWIGKGLLSYSSIESIISYCSALESLLIRDANIIISPSIVASLSEYCAFLLGNSPSSRKKILSLVKSIYSERSAGTHGGKIVADIKIEQTALSISRAMVFRLIELYPQQIKTEQDLIDYVDQIKFS